MLQSRAGSGRARSPSSRNVSTPAAFVIIDQDAAVRSKQDTADRNSLRLDVRLALPERALRHLYDKDGNAAATTLFNPLSDGLGGEPSPIIVRRP